MIISVTPPALPHIDPAQCNDTCDISDVTATTATWVGPLLPAGSALVGPIVGLVINSRAGRKWTMVGLAVLLIVGWTLLLISKFADSVVLILVGRFVNGESNKSAILLVGSTILFSCAKIFGIVVNMIFFIFWDKI